MHLDLETDGYDVMSVRRQQWTAAAAAAAAAAVAVYAWEKTHYEAAKMRDIQKMCNSEGIKKTVILYLRQQ